MGEETNGNSQTVNFVGYNICILRGKRIKFLSRKKKSRFVIMKIMIIIITSTTNNFASTVFRCPIFCMLKWVSFLFYT